MKQNRIIGVIGTTGSGKTYTVADYLKTQNRFVVFDIMGDSSYLGPADEVIDNRAELLAAMRQPEFRVVYRAKIGRDEKTKEITVPDLDFVVDAAYAIGDMVLVVDEAHILCDSRNIPSALFLATTTGRHQRLSIIYVTQRFAAVARILTSNTHEFWFWRITEPADLQGIKERCGMDVADRVREARRLERKGGVIVPGEMIRWTVEDGLVGEAPAPEEEEEFEEEEEPLS